MTKRIDLNADVGEGAGTDAALLQIVSSASIACGGHAGDAETMRDTLRLARNNGVRVGAHPGFADKQNFGRVRLNLPLDEIAAQVRAQVDALLDIAATESVQVAYIKLHGALANMAAEDEELASACFSVWAELVPDGPVLALDSSAQVAAAEALGLPVIREAYADRAYQANGLLASRTLPGAVLDDPEAVISQCLSLAERGELSTIDGGTIPSRATSICIHGDTPGAVAFAARIRSELERQGVEIGV